MNDYEIGRNLSDARDDAGLTQVALAEKMRSHGFRWSQATVWSVEKGERPLRLSEAAKVGYFLNIGPFDLLRTAEDSEASRAVRRAGERLADVEEAIEQYGAARAIMFEHGFDGLSEDDQETYLQVEQVPSFASVSKGSAS